MSLHSEDKILDHCVYCGIVLEKMGWITEYHYGSYLTTAGMLTWVSGVCDPCHQRQLRGEQLEMRFPKEIPLSASSMVFPPWLKP